MTPLKSAVAPSLPRSVATNPPSPDKRKDVEQRRPRSVYLSVVNIRKILAVVFGALSLFFALIAARNRYCAGCPAAQPQAWNCGLGETAKVGNKLIFVCAGSSGALTKKNADFAAKNYVCAVLDRNKNSADFEVYNTFFKSVSRAKTDFVCAVLTPNFAPVYMSDKIDNPKLEKLLKAVAQSYRKDREKFAERAEAAAVRVRARMAFDAERERIFGAFGGDLRARNAHSHSNTPPAAVLTENARLQFANLKIRPSVLAAKQSAKFFDALKRLYASAAHPAQKLLAARAMADAAFAVAPEKLAEVRQCADAVAAGQTSASSAVQPANSANISAEKPLSELALSLSVLCRAAKIFGDKKYARAAETIAKKIADTAADSPAACDCCRRAEEAAYPAKINAARAEKHTCGAQPLSSYASALDIALAANALCDYAAFENSPRAFDAARKLLNLLEADYRQNSVWTLNSKRSPSARFARITVLRDIDAPSYTGEAYQAIAKIKRHYALRTTEATETRAAQTRTAAPEIPQIKMPIFTMLDAANYASLKLALLP